MCVANQEILKQLEDLKKMLEVQIQTNENFNSRLDKIEKNEVEPFLEHLFKEDEDLPNEYVTKNNKSDYVRRVLTSEPMPNADIESGEESIKKCFQLFGEVKSSIDIIGRMKSEKDKKEMALRSFNQIQKGYFND